MNVVWTGVMLVGLGLLTINNVDMAMDAMFNGTSKAITLSLKLWGIYTLWLGILKIVEETGLDKKLSKLFKPLIKVLFGKTDDYTSEQISVNLTSNFLGMGNASTPSGINSISGMDKGSKYATSGMIMMIVLNSTSMQLIPTTVVGLRITAGSNSPSDIIIPTLVATIVCAVSGALLVKLFSKIFKDKE
jgi:spore maturation protein A